MWLSTLIALIITLVILWLWQSNMRAKELAFNTAKSLCELHQVQLFDQTVSLKQFKLKRLPDGRMAFWRLYEFDYGTDSSTRYRGRIITHGHEVIEQSLKFQDGPSVLNRVVNLAPVSEQYFPEKSDFSNKILEFKNLKKPANDPDPNEINGI